MSSSAELSAQSSHKSFFGYTGWFLAATLFFYAWVLRVSPSVMVEHLMRDFAVSGAVLGNLSAVYFYFYASLQLPVGLAHDRWGPRRVLSLSALVAGAGAVVFAYAPTLEMAYLGRAMIGAGCAFGLVGSMLLAAAWFAPRYFAVLSACAMSFGFIGGIVGQAPVAHLVEMQGWRHAMLILACGSVAISVLTWAFTRDRPAGTTTPRPSSKKNSEPLLTAIWKVARQRQILLIALFASTVGAPSLVFGALWGVPYIMTAYGIGKTQAAFAVSSILFGWVVGGPFWGWLSDRMSRRKLPIIIASTIALVTISAVLYVPDLSLNMLWVLLFINGFCAASMAISYAFTREQDIGERTGAALGLVNMFAVGGGALFQPLVGYSLDTLWDGTIVNGARIYSAANFTDAFLILPILYIFALGAALCVRETYCKPVSAQ